uniref:Tripartite motif-containing protein 16-like n=1 Tax=Pygocentrus nattereri TaxID=42514 RepID=A0AAR2KWI1_PYGNA
MAEAALKALDSFNCPICLDLLKDPVTIPCGHSYCLDCIKDCWAEDDQRGVYSCPQCRHSFTPRPVLNKNTMLAELAEGLRKTRLQAAPPAGSPAGSGDVECDVCTGLKLRAVESCLVCLLSFCEAHIQPHYESPAYKKHKLVEASMNLQEKICSLHDKLLEVFCRTDQQCICYLCVMDEHSGHKTVSAAAERSEKQKQLVDNQRKFQQRIQQTENKLQELKQAMDNLRRSAQAAVEDSEKIFSELIESIERRRSEVKELIRAQEKTELSQAEDLLKKLEQEIADLRRRDAELEQLSHSEDHIHFLQVTSLTLIICSVCPSFQWKCCRFTFIRLFLSWKNLCVCLFMSLQSFQSLSAPPQPADLPCITISPQFFMKHLKKAVTGVMERVKGEAVKFSGGIVSSSMTPDTWQKPQQFHQLLEPKTREDFLTYSCQISLDPNTANRQLALSERNRKVTVMRKIQKHPDHPERFDGVQQVLCRESLTGRCYWEVEFRGYYFDVVVSYKGVSRKGNQSGFGSNDQSWSLICSDSRFSFRHNNKQTELPVKSSSSRIGVYVDHSAGILSFYSVSDTMTLLHRVHTTFTQPLYPGFAVYGYGNVLQICDLN